MDSKMIGFLGADKYDILLYLSKILTRLNQKVLLVDYSENRALTCCIPIPGKRQGILTIRDRTGAYLEPSGRKTEEERISYQGIDFLIEPLYGQLMEMKERYDLILVDLGFQVYSKLIHECNQIYLSLDQQLHNIMQLKPISLMGEEVEKKCFILFRQVYDCKISTAYLLEELALNVPEDNIFPYYQETMDMKYCIDSQYNHTFHFAHISRGLKSCLLYLLRNLLPQLSEQQRKSAYKTARACHISLGRN